MASPTAIKRKPLPTTSEDTEHETVRDQLPAPEDSVSESVGNQSPAGDKPKDQGRVNRTKSQLNLWHKVALIAIIFGCTLVICGTIAYLSFLWFGGPSKTIWKSIVLANWAATSVAICGIVIRWMTAFQMVLCTSIFAWGILRNGSELKKIPRIAGLRFNNAGPLDLILLLPARLKPSSCFQTTILVLLSIAVSLMIQFSSTLLLSDLAPAPVETFPVFSSANLVSGSQNDRDVYSKFYADAFMTTAPTFPLFAELSNNTKLDQVNGVDDTGPTLRALLPISSGADRAKMLSYKGNATLFDARVICTPPKLQFVSLTGSPARLFFRGEVEPSVLIPPMVSSRPSHFDCEMIETLVSASSWTVFTCNFGAKGWGWGTLNTLDRVFDPLVIHNKTDRGFDGVPYLTASNGTNYTYAGGTPIGETYLVINVTGVRASDILSLPQYQSPNELYHWEVRYNLNDTEAWTSSTRGPWTRITSTQEDGIEATRVLPWETVPRSLYEPVTIDASLCSSGYSSTKSMRIDVTRPKGSEEPETLDDGIVQIGAGQTSRSLQERGVMILNETAINEVLNQERDSILQERLDGPALPWSVLLKLDFITNRWWIPTGLPTGISFENTTQPINWHGASEDRITLFQHSLINMNSPALAIQSMIHTFVTDRFYKYMPLLEESTSQLTTYSTDAVFPVRTRGFIAVMVALGAHFTLVAYTLIILSGFYDINRTFRSTDQAWQVFTQVGRLQREVEREDAEVTVENAENGNSNFRWTTATDHQVEKHLKERGLKDRVFALEDDREDASVYFRSKG